MIMKNKQQENRKFKLIGILAIILTSTFVFANNESITTEQFNNLLAHKDSVYNFTVLDKKPEFPGGMGKLMIYLVKNTKYPKAAKEVGIQGKVFVGFIINKRGKITHVKLIKSVSKELDEEAIRVISSMPKWAPGKQHGKKVKVKYIIPINFKLPKKATNANDFTAQKDSVYVFNEIEIKPEFPGGMGKLMIYLVENTKYPQISRENDIQGKVYVQFVINKKGEVTDVKLKRKVSKELDKEALRVVSSMPNWSPGIQRGKKVKVSYIVPINFKLTNRKIKTKK